MKTLFTLLTVAFSLFALPPIASAKDKDKKDRYYEADKKAWKETRDDVRELREQYGRLEETAHRENSSRRIREQISDIGAGVQQVSAQFERGTNDYRDVRGRVARLDQAINSVRQQIDYDRSRQSGYYYSRDRERDRSWDDRRR